MKPPCERGSAGIQPHVALPPTATSLPPLEKVSASLVISWLGSVMFRRLEGLALQHGCVATSVPAAPQAVPTQLKNPSFLGFFQLLGCAES